MALITANYFLKWLSRLIPIKRSDALTTTVGNDSGSKESVNQHGTVGTFVPFQFNDHSWLIQISFRRRYTMSAKPFPDGSSLISV